MPADVEEVNHSIILASILSSSSDFDLLYFNVQSNVPNHCGVYLDGDLLLHHAYNRLSCRELLYPFWAKHKTRILRNEKCKQ